MNGKVHHLRWVFYIILFLVKVEEVLLTVWAFLHLVRFINAANVKIKVNIIVAVDKLTI